MRREQELVARHDDLERRVGARLQRNRDQPAFLHVAMMARLEAIANPSPATSRLLDRGQAAELGAQGDLAAGDTGRFEEFVGDLADAVARIAVDEGMAGEGRGR